MMEVKLSHRLEAVASFIPFGTNLLDVGSDHAYLPIAMASKGHINYAVAGEVVAGPYELALANVAKMGLQNQIKVRLASGLKAMTPGDEIETVTICGMGGRLIATILREDLETLSAVNRLILQPNNREDELRSFLNQHQYAIVDEAIVTEQGKDYEIILAEKGNQKLDAADIQFGPCLRRQSSFIFKEKWQKELTKLEAIAKQIPSHNKPQLTALFDKIHLIKENVLDECS